MSEVELSFRQQIILGVFQHVKHADQERWFRVNGHERPTVRELRLLEEQGLIRITCSTTAQGKKHACPL